VGFLMRKIFIELALIKILRIKKLGSQRPAVSFPMVVGPPLGSARRRSANP